MGCDKAMPSSFTGLALFMLVLLFVLSHQHEGEDRNLYYKNQKQKQNILLIQANDVGRSKHSCAICLKQPKSNTRSSTTSLSKTSRFVCFTLGASLCQGKLRYKYNTSKSGAAMSKWTLPLLQAELSEGHTLAPSIISRNVASTGYLPALTTPLS